jgi:hypothetical protein
MEETAARSSIVNMKRPKEENKSGMLEQLQVIEEDGEEDAITVNVMS